MAAWAYADAHGSSTIARRMVAQPIRRARGWGAALGPRAPTLLVVVVAWSDVAPAVPECPVIRNIQRNIQTSHGAVSTTAATTAVITNSGASQNMAAHAGECLSAAALRLDVARPCVAGRRTAVRGRRRSALDGLFMRCSNSSLVSRPAAKITEGGDGPVSLGITDANLGLLGWSRIHRAVGRWPYPQHVLGEGSAGPDSFES
jgi:hypothetical protein